MKYVLFTESEENYDSHVCVFDYIKGKWYWINPFSYEFNLIFHPVAEKVLWKLLEQHEHYKIEDDYEPTKFAVGSKLILSCVGVVKFYLGIKSTFIFTPEHLRLYLQGKKISPTQKVARSFESIVLYTILTFKRIKAFYGSLVGAISFSSRKV